MIYQLVDRCSLIHLIFCIKNSSLTACFYIFVSNQLHYNSKKTPNNKSYKKNEKIRYPHWYRIRNGTYSRTQKQIKHQIGGILIGLKFRLLFFCQFLFRRKRSRFSDQDQFRLPRLTIIMDYARNNWTLRFSTLNCKWRMFHMDSFGG